MIYSIRHLTRFTYSSDVTESFLEARMQPRSEGLQRCLEFELTVRPRANVDSYIDYLGNVVHHFDIATHHTELAVLAESLVEVNATGEVSASLPESAWTEIDDYESDGTLWDFLHESHFATATPLLEELAAKLDIRRRDDPLTVLHQLNRALFASFDYVPNSTRVDSPIDEALGKRAGVCQDFAHIMVTLVRQLGIPCRYVSGYVYSGEEDHDRSSDGATHAWAEALLPELGWVGFDPTNALVAGPRHIRAAIGRDYADVPPTKGVFKGGASGKLGVSVTVVPVETVAPPLPPEMVVVDQQSIPGSVATRYHDNQHQQQQ